MTNIHLLGVPMEEGAGRRGCIMGPAAYRTAGLAEELAALGHNVTDLGDAAREDVDAVETEHTHLKFLPEVAGWTRSLHARSHALAKQDALPIYMGGDHALALGTVTGHVAAAARWADRNTYYGWTRILISTRQPARPAGIFMGCRWRLPAGWTGSRIYWASLCPRNWIPRNCA